MSVLKPPVSSLNQFNPGYFLALGLGFALWVGFAPGAGAFAGEPVCDGVAAVSAAGLTVAGAAGAELAAGDGAGDACGSGAVDCKTE